MFSMLFTLLLLQYYPTMDYLYEFLCVHFRTVLISKLNLLFLQTKRKFHIPSKYNEMISINLFSYCYCSQKVWTS